ncbi:MAG: YihY/virulence factor BrkB family protein [Hyphomicrobium sp.]|nr:YihY/virulence factor BrkB family protein [Hyphomicrobium sp.]
MPKDANLNGSALRKPAAAAAVTLMGFAVLRRLGVRKDDQVVHQSIHGSRGADRGRRADRPSELGTLGWRDVLWRTYAEFSDDRILMIAAGITFYGLLALFPALTALVSIAGLVIDPSRIVEQVQSLSGVVPEAAIGIISDQLQRIAEQPANSLSFAFMIGLAIALWSANNGIKAMFEGLNIVYDEEEDRSFLRLNAVSLMFTLGAMVTIIIALGAIVVVPALLGFVGLGGLSSTLINLGRWPVLFAFIIVGIGLLYRFGPSRRPARWRWISVGSVLAAVLWVVMSAVFSWYVSNFNSYNQTYGSLGAVIAFMVWMWISASIILLGAELNAELEHQTARDTTISPEKPMGNRGAHAADTVGKRMTS